jgi:hypothetical protein
MIQKAFLAVLMLITVPLFAQKTKEPDGLRNFVQDFYHWYVPIALKDNKVPASDIALKERPAAFSAELLKALKEDSEAQANSPGDIVGIDWDPFLNSQDPDKHYEVGRIVQKGETYRANIHGFRSGKKIIKPSAIAEVGRESGRWVFLDFYSPDGGSLLAALKTLKADRQKAPK